MKCRYAAIKEGFIEAIGEVSVKELKKSGAIKYKTYKEMVKLGTKAVKISIEKKGLFSYSELSRAVVDALINTDKEKKCQK